VNCLSLTNAISALERELGGPLFQRKPFTAMTALGYAIQPYMQRIVDTADQALQTAQAFADRRSACNLRGQPDTPASTQVRQGSQGTRGSGVGPGGLRGSQASVGAEAVEGPPPSS
jgi:hypothetical protein